MKLTGRIIAVLVLLAALVAGLFVTRRTPGARAVQRKPTPIAVTPASSRVEPPSECAHRPADPTVAYSPPVVSDPALRSLVDRRLGLDERIPADITARLPAVKDAQNLALLSGILADPAEPDTVRHEVASLLARSDYDKLIPTLLDVLHNPAEGKRFRGWVVQHLQLNYAAAAANTQATILAELRTSLTDRHETVRRESLLALHRLAPGEGLAVARAWLHDTAAGADAERDLAIRVIREQDARDELAAVRQYARHPEPALRIAALVTLAAWKDEASRDAMADAAASADPRLRRCGERALAQLAATPTARDAPPE